MEVEGYVTFFRTPQVKLSLGTACGCFPLLLRTSLGWTVILSQLGPGVRNLHVSVGAKRKSLP